MIFQPNYTEPTMKEHQQLLCDEAWLVQSVEHLNMIGNKEEASFLNQYKNFVSIRRKCMKAALKHIKMQQVIPTLTAEGF